jgi:hypothetical protein
LLKNDLLRKRLVELWQQQQQLLSAAVAVAVAGHRLVLRL